MGFAIAAIVILVVLVAAFLWWRYTSVERGARQVEAKILSLLEPLAQKLSGGVEPTPEEIAGLAAKPITRYHLYLALKHYERLHLFPDEYRTEQAQAEAKLALWMMHPNELQDVPEKMEPAATVVREVGGETCRFYVFRYRMAPGHWHGEDWEIAVSGPFVNHEPPYSDLPGAFSRFDKYNEVSPEELVDWFLGMARGKARA